MQRIVAVVAFLACADVAAASCDSVQAAAIADAHSLPTCDADPLPGGPPACIGKTANFCAAYLYDNPQSVGPGSGTFELAFLPKCEDGTDTCPVEEQLHCIDSTRPAIYWKAGHNNKWVFYLGGEGGPCSKGLGPGGCFVQLTDGGPGGDSVTSRDVTDFSKKGGVFGWNGWNRVLFDKCHVGEADRGAQVDTASVSQTESGFSYTYTEFHQGRKIWNALFAYLADTNNPTGLQDFNLAKQVVLAGHSDGAKGLIYSGDSLRDSLRTELAEPTLDVRLVLDGHFLPSIEAEFAVGNGNPGCVDSNMNGVADFYDFCTLPGLLPPDGLASGDGYSKATYEPGGRLHDANVGHGAVIDASCGPSFPHDPTKRSGCHNEMHLLLNHVETPFFARMDLKDNLWIETAPQHALDPDYNIPNTAFKDRVRRIAQDLIDFHMIHAEEPASTFAGLYIPFAGGVTSHVGLTNAAEFKAELLQQCVGGVSQGLFSTEEILEAWLDDDAASPMGDYQALYRKVTASPGDTWVGPAEVCPL